MPVTVDDRITIRKSHKEKLYSTAIAESIGKNLNKRQNDVIIFSVVDTESDKWLRKQDDREENDEYLHIWGGKSAD